MTAVLKEDAVLQPIDHSTRRTVIRSGSRAAWHNSATASMTFACDVGDERSHGVSSGLYRTSCDLGLMLGPVLLGWIADTSNFAWALYFNAALLMAGILLFATLARGTGRPAPERAIVEAEG